MRSRRPPTLSLTSESQRVNAGRHLEKSLSANKTHVNIVFKVLNYTGVMSPAPSSEITGAFERGFKASFDGCAMVHSGGMAFVQVASVRLQPRTRLDYIISGIQGLD
jgi:hypothetical protein